MVGAVCPGPTHCRMTAGRHACDRLPQINRSVTWIPSLVPPSSPSWSSRSSPCSPAAYSGCAAARRAFPKHGIRTGHGQLGLGNPVQITRRKRRGANKAVPALGMAKARIASALRVVPRISRQGLTPVRRAPACRARSNRRRTARRRTDRAARSRPAANRACGCRARRSHSRPRP